MSGDGDGDGDGVRVRVRVRVLYLGNPLGIGMFWSKYPLELTSLERACLDASLGMLSMSIQCFLRVQ